MNEGKPMSLPEELAVSWIGKYGSARLKNAVLEKGGVKEILWKIYLIERLAIELPDWKISPRDGFLAIKNPSEIERNALGKAQGQFPEGNVRLSLAGLYDVARVPVLIMDCPWSKEDKIVFYIDKSPRLEIW
jgi:hypothetical protein